MYLFVFVSLNCCTISCNKLAKTKSICLTRHGEKEGLPSWEASLFFTLDFFDLVFSDLFEFLMIFFEKDFFGSKKDWKKSDKKRQPKKREK